MLQRIKSIITTGMGVITFILAWVLFIVDKLSYIGLTGFVLLSVVLIFVKDDEVKGIFKYLTEKLIK
jgi:hypothetical protein